MTSNFTTLRRKIEKEDENREQIIQLSRKIISLSKRVIYALHRKDSAAASKFVKDIKKEAAVLKKINNPLDTNIASTAFQEYVEALCYDHYIKTGTLLDDEKLGVSSQDYLMGVCDLTGELMRKAVDYAINKEYAAVIRIKEFVSVIYGEFLGFNLRNGELRKKSDAIKWNLQKLEDLVLDITKK